MRMSKGASLGECLPALYESGIGVALKQPDPCQKAAAVHARVDRDVNREPVLVRVIMSDDLLDVRQGGIEGAAIHQDVSHDPMCQEPDRVILLLFGKGIKLLRDLQSCIQLGAIGVERHEPV